CQSIADLVTPFIDGELGDAERRAVDEHLRRCAPCQSRVAAERAVHDLCRVRQAALAIARAPETPRDPWRGLAHASHASRPSAGHSHPPTAPARQPIPMPVAPRRAVPVRSRLTPLALAATLVLIVGGAFLYQATAASARLMAAELAADHVRCFAVN